MGRLIKLYKDNTSEKELKSIAEALDRGAIIIYPTDTLYALGCSLNNIKAISRIKEVKHKDNDNLSLIFSDISQLSEYARVDNREFKIVRRNTPGPFTFILNASKSVPNKFLERKQTVGVRIPDNSITRSIVEMLGCPLVSTSLVFRNLEEAYRVNPELIWEEYRNKVDIMVDGGEATLTPSAVVNLSDGDIEIIREGTNELTIE